MTNEEAVKILVNVIEPPILRNDGRSVACLQACEAIEKAVLALEAEPKRGRWEYETRKLSNGYGWYDALVCTVCYRSAPSKYRYCPNCGARMDKVKE